MQVAVIVDAGEDVALPCQIFSESEEVVAVEVREAIPPLVANPKTVIDAVAVGVPDPNLTLLHIAAVVQAAFTVACPLTTNTLFAVVVTLAEGLAELSLTLVALIVLLAVLLELALASLILAPLAVVLTLVVDEPLTRAEPSGTLLALQEMELPALAVALDSWILTQDAVAEEVAVITVCRSASS